MRTRGHHHVVLRADGVGGTVWHLDRSHHRTDVVLVVGTELAVVVGLALLVTSLVEVVVVELLASHGTHNPQVVLVGRLVAHGAHGEVPGLAHALLLRRPHPELLGHERVGQYGALLQAVRPALAQHQPGDKESIWTLARTREAASEYRAPDRAKVQLSSKSSARAPRCDVWSYHKSLQSLDLKLQLKL